MNDDEFDWRLEAKCRGVDPDLFFPERGASLAAAKQVCFECPVRMPCLEYALDNREVHGVWGGISERGRRALRRERNVARSAASERKVCEHCGQAFVPTRDRQRFCDKTCARSAPRGGLVNMRSALRTQVDAEIERLEAR